MGSSSAKVMKRKLRRSAALLSALGFCFGASVGAQTSQTPSDRILQARLNYEALQRGDIGFHELTPQQLQDMIDLDRALRREDRRSPAQKCVDEEVRRAGGSPSQLHWRSIDLKCRNLGGPVKIPR